MFLERYEILLRAVRHHRRAARGLAQATRPASPLEIDPFVTQLTKLFLPHLAHGSNSTSRERLDRRSRVGFAAAGVAAAFFVNVASFFGVHAKPINSAALVQALAKLLAPRSDHPVEGTVTAPA